MNNQGMVFFAAGMMIGLAIRSLSIAVFLDEPKDRLRSVLLWCGALLMGVAGLTFGILGEASKNHMAAITWLAGIGGLTMILSTFKKRNNGLQD